jgi:hypothetical protein
LSGVVVQRHADGVGFDQVPVEHADCHALFEGESLVRRHARQRAGEELCSQAFAEISTRGWKSRRRAESICGSRELHLRPPFAISQSHRNLAS